MMDELMSRLAEAIQAVNEAQTAADSIEHKLSQAKQALEQAQADRAAHITALSVGGSSIMDLAAVDRAGAEVTMFEQALQVTQQRIDTADQAVDAILLALASERAAAVQREYTEAEQASVRAIAHRQAVFQRLQSANRLATSGNPASRESWKILDQGQQQETEAQARRRQQASDILRTAFAAELEAAQHAGAK